MKGILLDAVKTPTQRTFDCTIQDIQCDNQVRKSSFFIKHYTDFVILFMIPFFVLQLFEPQCPVVLYVTRGLREDEPKKCLPAVQISAHKQTCNNSNAHIFQVN